MPQKTTYVSKVVISDSKIIISRTKILDTDLGKLNLLMMVRFYARAIYNTAPAASKNNARFKSGQNRLKHNHITLLI